MPLLVRLALLTSMTLVIGASVSLAADESPYAGAAKCKMCHSAIYQSWQGTKHAKALSLVDPAQRKSDCISCHVPGTPEMIAAEKDTPSFPDVQCEACHGAAKAHTQNPKNRAGLIADPDEASCRRCHNEKSPHFHGFVYAAMKPFVHPK